MSSDSQQSQPGSSRQRSPSTMHYERSSKRLKISHLVNDYTPANAPAPLWQRLDDQSPRTRRMGRMAFSQPPSSPEGSSSSPSRMADEIATLRSSPTAVPSSPLDPTTTWSYPRKRKGLDEDDEEDDSTGSSSEVNGLQLLLKVIEQQQPDIFSPCDGFASPEVKLEAVEDLPASPAPPPELHSAEDSSPSDNAQFDSQPSDCLSQSLSPAPETPLREARALPSPTAHSPDGPSIFDHPSSPLSSAQSSPLSSPAPSIKSLDEPEAPASHHATPVKPTQPPKAGPVSPSPQEKELAGLIVSAFAFGGSTSLTSLDIAEAVSKDAPHLLDDLPASRAPLTECVMTANAPSDKKGKSKAAGKKKSVKARKQEQLMGLAVVIEGVLASAPMFGRVDRKGEDAAGEPLRPMFHYEPDLDPDQDRAMTIRACGMRSKRRATKHHVQYHFAPVSLNRFELAAEEDD